MSEQVHVQKEEFRRTPSPQRKNVSPTRRQRTPSPQKMSTRQRTPSPRQQQRGQKFQQQSEGYQKYPLQSQHEMVESIGTKKQPQQQTYKQYYYPNIRQRTQYTEQKQRQQPFVKNGTFEENQPHQQQQQQFLHDPTIHYFNKLVPRYTHSFLGETGVKISRICLGTMNFGKIDDNFGERPGQLNEQQAHEILDRYVELGGNCIDCANFFPWFGSTVGESERIVGNWLKNQNRDQLFIITKIRMPTDFSNINSGGLSRGSIIQAVDACLKRLQTNRIDLLLVSGTDENTNVFDNATNLNDLIVNQKVNYLGVCDLKGWQFQKVIDVNKNLKTHKKACYQGEYNLLTRGCEWEIFDICEEEDIGFIAYSPLKYGLLSDEYLNSDMPVKGSRVEAASGQHPNLSAMACNFDEVKDNPVYQPLLQCCERIGKKHNLTVSQVALQWVLQNPNVTSVVIGAYNVKQLDDNMKLLNESICLSFDEICELNEICCVQTPYPYATHLSHIIGSRKLHFTPNTSFEQLTLLTDQELQICEHRRRYRTPSPTRSRSQSPLSPQQRRSPSPTKRRSPSPPKRRSPSPKKQQQHVKQQEFTKNQ